MSNKKEPTKITVVNIYGKYSITTDSSDLDLDGFVDNLIIPLLHAVGFHHDSIKERFGV